VVSLAPVPASISARDCWAISVTEYDRVCMSIRMLRVPMSVSGLLCLANRRPLVSAHGSSHVWERNAVARTHRSPRCQPRPQAASANAICDTMAQLRPNPAIAMASNSSQVAIMVATIAASSITRYVAAAGTGARRIDRSLAGRSHSNQNDFLIEPLQPIKLIGRARIHGDAHVQ
jgi:hypothetical protein